MTIDKIIAKLPIRPRHGMEDAVLKGCRDALGPEFCLFKRVSTAESDLGFCGWPDVDDRNDPPPGWCAECRCGKCGEVWHSGWIDKESISLILGEDGLPYAGVPDMGDIRAIPYKIDERLRCPFCDTELQLIPTQKLRGGRFYRNRVGSLENVGDYTVILVWMAERYVSSDGEAVLSIFPEYAAAITEGDDLIFFQFDTGHWHQRKSKEDPFQLFYGSHGNVPNRTVGAWLWPDVPDQLGQSGEKTGIADYFRSGGRWPVMYLRFWQSYPAIENIVKAGWLNPFEDAGFSTFILRCAMSRPTSICRREGMKRSDDTWVCTSRAWTCQTAA